MLSPLYDIRASQYSDKLSFPFLHVHFLLIVSPLFPGHIPNVQRTCHHTRYLTSLMFLWLIGARCSGSLAFLNFSLCLLSHATGVDGRMGSGRFHPGPIPLFALACHFEYLT